MTITEAQIIKAVESYCNIVTSSTALTAYFDGGFEDFIVKVGPIISITSITDTYATQSVSDDTVLTATAYNFDESKGLIWRYDGADWQEGRKRWKVVYVAGYGTIPADLQVAIDTWLGYYQVNTTGVVSMYKTGDDSEQYVGASTNDIPKSVRVILDKYKRTVYIR